MTASPDIDRLFQEGVSAIRAGDKTTGREKLLQVVELDEMHEQGWLWLSATVETDEDRIVCLENVLTINPDNEPAQRGLEKLTGRTTPSPPPSAQAEPSPATSPPPAPAEPPPPATPASIPDPPVPTPPQPAEPDLSTPSEPELLTPAASEGGSLLSAIESRSRGKDPSPSGGLLFDDDDEPAQLPSPPGDESWRQPLAEAAPPPASSRSRGASSAWARDADEEPVADRSILDLFDAWFAAMLFNAKESFALELPIAAWDRVLVNLVFTGLVAAMGGIFQFLLIATLGGGSLDAFVSEQYGELFDALSQAGVNISQFMGTIGIIYLVVIVVGTVLLGLFTGIGTHIASRILGGSGEMIETLHLLTMARVAYQIVDLLPMIITAIVPGLSVVLWLAAFFYNVAINVFAISYVHQEFGIGKSITTLILGGFIATISLGVVFCCIGFAAAALLGVGAS